MKKSKNSLKRDSVNSNTIHVGIELELIAKCDGSCSSHNDDACHDSYRSMLEEDSSESILMDNLGLNTPIFFVIANRNYTHTSSTFIRALKKFQKT